MLALRLDYDSVQDCLILRRLNYKRFSFHGYGSFLWKPTAEEISLSPAALEALSKRIGKESDLGDMSGAGFNYNTTAADKKERGFVFDYGFTGPFLEVPMEEVIIDLKSFELLKTASISKSEPPVSKTEQEDLEAWQQMMDADEAMDESLMDKIRDKFYSREEIP